MKIILDNIGKRYNQEWIFRGVKFEFNKESPTVILGSNGSGKSTLLQVILGNLTQSEGQISYYIENKKIEVEDVFSSFSFASPYMELFEELTLTEIINFHANFKRFVNNIDTEKVIELMQLHKARNKELKYYSSGMKQRVKLGLAILSNTPALLLDEPLSNLDRNGIDWYQSLINEFALNRLIIVCSNNQQDEFFFSKNTLIVEDFKRK